MTPTTNEQAVEDLYDAYGARDLERFLALLHPDVEWELANWLGGGVRHGRESLRDYMRLLDEHAASSTLKEVVELAHQTVARSEGGATYRDTSTRVGGVAFRVFSLVGGLITKTKPYVDRTAVLDALGLTRPERQGLLTVKEDDDERLYHFGIDKGAKMTWAPYAEHGTWDHDHCEMCWATFSTSTKDQQEGYATLDRYRWLCPDCFDEVKDHFRLRLTE